MTLYIENSKDTTKKLLELTNEFSKAARQKHTELYFSTLTMNFQNENLRIPFTTASKRVRYLAINPTEEIRGHYSDFLLSEMITMRIKGDKHIKNDE